MSFRSDNDAYEAWLARQCAVVAADIKYKHKRMKKNAFVFLRATYFRWAKTIETLCPELTNAPRVLSVGDMHLENFGTWRDAEGRLVWGVNDFDEAAAMPYAFDLVRLVTSIRLAPGGSIGKQVAADAILKGYRAGLADPHPALLDQRQNWMRPYAIGADEGSGDFWKEVHAYPDAAPPKPVAQALRASLPKHSKLIRFGARVAGGGSLGRQRFVAIAEWQGGYALREAKASVPSAWIWAHDRTSRISHLPAMANGKFRAPDPFLDLRARFVIRRIAPDSRKIELGAAAAAGLGIDVLQAMGFDLASIHAAGSLGAAPLQADLKKQPRGWLHAAAKTAEQAVQHDFMSWRK
ncbi:MAG: hypothetical protein JWR49_1396 [Tardiphaga sp.]|nr:hypothetical protein [Tardiphaga sp.]